MRAEDIVRLRYLIDASEHAMQFVAGRRTTDLATDRILQFALLRAIECSLGTMATLHELQQRHHDSCGRRNRAPYLGKTLKLRCTP